MTGSCELANEHPGSLQFGEFLYLLRNFLSYQKGLCFVEVVVTKKCSQILISIGGSLQTWVYIFRLLLFMDVHSKWLINKLDQTLTCLHR